MSLEKQLFGTLLFKSNFGELTDTTVVAIVTKSHNVKRHSEKQVLKIITADINCVMLTFCSLLMLI